MERKSRRLPRKSRNRRACVARIGVTGDLRVRYYGETARVELSPDELARWRTDEGRGAFVTPSWAPYCAELDLRGFRSGSLNRVNERPLIELLGAF